MRYFSSLIFLAAKVLRKTEMFRLKLSSLDVIGIFLGLIYIFISFADITGILLSIIFDFAICSQLNY